MIVLDRDVLVKLGNQNPTVLNHLGQYSSEEWTIPAHVALESFNNHTTRQDMTREQFQLRQQLDRILDFTDDTALEAAYLRRQLQSQNVHLDIVDLLNLASACENGAIFVTHDKNDFRKAPIQQLADIDVVTP